MTAPLSPNARLRYHVLQSLLAPIQEGISLLEIGCGQGGLATILAQRYEYLGYEPDAESFQIAQERLEKLGRGRVQNERLPTNPDRFYDVVAAFEVLEHMEDDASTLDAWTKWIRPRGYLLLSVPAHPNRFGPGDEYGGHYRRYTRDGLTSLLATLGLTDIRIRSYGFPLGFALESARNLILARRLKQAPMSPAARTAGSGRILQLSHRLAPLIWALTLPFTYIQRPFAGGDLGIGYVIRARRPS
jgi:SAM-dependent methyltransferase